MTVPTEHLLALGAVLFAIGVAGFFTRRNLIVVLMSIELMLNAVNLTFVAGARMHSSSGLTVSAPIVPPLVQPMCATTMSAPASVIHLASSVLKT